MFAPRVTERSRRTRTMRTDDTDDADERVRFDKWLWAARFYKTRSLAAQAIDAGQARVGGERVKPAHAMRARRNGVGPQVRARLRSDVLERVRPARRRDGRREALPRNRREPRGARSIPAAEGAAQAAAPRSAGRPTKRQRRKLEDFLNEP